MGIYKRKNTMKLLTKELKNKIPPLYSQDGKGLEAIAYLKLFNPCGSETWYITEASAEIEQDNEITEKALKDILPDDNVIDIRMYGLITGSQFDELGYFSLNELESIGLNPKMKLNQNVITITGLKIERDMYFESQPLKNFYKEI